MVLTVSDPELGADENFVTVIRTGRRREIALEPPPASTRPEPEEPQDFIHTKKRAGD